MAGQALWVLVALVEQTAFAESVVQAFLDLLRQYLGRGADIVEALGEQIAEIDAPGPLA